MRLALALLAVATTADAAPPRLARHIAPMFELGRTWVYDTSLTTWGDQDEHGKLSKATSHKVVTCKVVAVGELRGAATSHITCDDNSWKLTIPGYYLGTPAGLFEYRDTGDAKPADDDLAAILDQPPLIASAPRPFRKISRNTQSLEPVHNVYVNGIRTTPGGWCVYDDSSDDGPDGGKTSTCFVAGIGIASGGDDRGGELNDFRFSIHK